MLLRTTSILLACSFLVSGCSPEQAKPSSSSGAPAAATSAAPGSAAPAGVASGGKTAHFKRTQGECTFELDAPEELKESAKDGMSFTVESASFVFQGFDGTVLHSKPEHALDMFKGEYKDVYRGTEGGVQVAVVSSVDPSKGGTGKHAVSGMGGEPYASGRGEGCTFICDGARGREADVVKMCKSVRIAVKPGAK